VLEQGLRAIFILRKEGIAGGRKKLHIDELHCLYCSLNSGGRRTEIVWDRWDKRNALEKLKIRTIFQFETLKGRRTLGDLDLDEI
jgi:hypothetical protein